MFKNSTGKRTANRLSVEITRSDYIFSNIQEYRSEERIGHRGAPFERTVAEHYRKQGYRTMRAYASLGIWDLMCFRRLQDKWEHGAYHYCTEVIEVQVKGKESDPFTDEDKENLRKHAAEIGAEAHYAYGKRMPLRKPIGRRRLQKNRTVIIENLSKHATI